MLMLEQPACVSVLLLLWFVRCYINLVLSCSLFLWQNDLYWDDWSKMGIFKAPKSGSPNKELIIDRLIGVMDLKVFYKGKARGNRV